LLWLGCCFLLCSYANSRARVGLLLDFFGFRVYDAAAVFVSVAKVAARNIFVQGFFGSALCLSA